MPDALGTALDALQRSLANVSTLNNIVIAMRENTARLLEPLKTVLQDAREAIDRLLPLLPVVALGALLLVGCAGHRPQVINARLTPQPTLERPEAWLSKAYPETHCTAYLNVEATAQHVTWLEQAWEIPSWGSMIACPGSLKLCETIDVATCREVAQP